MNLTQTAVINGHDIKNMLLGAYAAFAAGYRQIDELNVFPVPDGDTGTNMMRTMEAVHRALLPLDTDSAAEVGAAAAKSAIMGARQQRRNTFAAFARHWARAGRQSARYRQ